MPDLGSQPSLLFIGIDAPPPRRITTPSPDPTPSTTTQCTTANVVNQIKSSNCRAQPPRMCTIIETTIVYTSMISTLSSRKARRSPTTVATALSIAPDDGFQGTRVLLRILVWIQDAYHIIDRNQPNKS
ncbi:hypothetical protein U1Q18_011822 [Sarracenia purpurea var. burkii]